MNVKLKAIILMVVINLVTIHDVLPHSHSVSNISEEFNLSSNHSHSHKGSHHHHHSATNSDDNRGDKDKSVDEKHSHFIHADFDVCLETQSKNLNKTLLIKSAFDLNNIDVVDINLYLYYLFDDNVCFSESNCSILFALRAPPLA